MFKHIMAGLISSVALFAAVSQAHAAITYDYVGDPFTNIGDSSLGDKISGSIAFSDLLPANYTGGIGSNGGLSQTGIVANASEYIASFRFSSSISASASSSTGYISQNGFDFKNGQIVDYLLTGFDPITAIAFTLSGQVGTTDIYDQIENTDTGLSNNNFAFGSTPLGTWTEVSSVPLPAALPLLGAAFAGLTGLGVRKSRINKAV